MTKALKFAIDRSHSAPPMWLQIFNEIMIMLESEELLPGDKLPSIKDMANEAGISCEPFTTAYAKLQMRKLIKTFKRRGTFVTNDVGQIAEILVKDGHDFRMALRNCLELAHRKGLTWEQFADYSMTIWIALFEWEGEE